MLVDDWMVEYQDIFLTRQFAVMAVVALALTTGCFISAVVLKRGRAGDGRCREGFGMVEAAFFFAASCLSQQGDGEIKPCSNYGRIVLLVGVTGGLLAYNIFTG